eukprot:7873531-Prorocentrum_lima.AAC.1
MNKLLHAIEEVSEIYGMRFSQANCELITFNTILGLSFRDGAAVKRCSEAKHLGCYANGKADPQLKITKHISA